MTSLSGRVAIVTGASSGIGRAIAVALAGDGAAVVVNHRDSPAQADAVVAGIRAAGGSARAVRADISSRQEHADLVSTTIQEFGRWDLLVANAAVTTTKPLAEFTEPDLDRLLAVNVKGLVWGLQLAADHLADDGRIVAISSSTTGLQLPGYSVYDATKAAMDQFVRIFAHEIGTRGITVNAVAPGATATETYAAGRG
jgi:3-oxoacyl-[acyl-carrier protein] reductase